MLVAMVNLMTLEIFSKYLQAGCLFCHPKKSINALKKTMCVLCTDVQTVAKGSAV